MPDGFTGEIEASDDDPLDRDFMVAAMYHIVYALYPDVPGSAEKAEFAQVVIPDRQREILDRLIQFRKDNPIE